ncbi:MAG: hypothetical protein R3C56_02370 [Pirellulaceae bacterium]
MNSSITWWLSVFSTGRSSTFDFAGFIQVDFDFGQMQLQRAVFIAIAAQNHRQRVHVAY